MTPFRTTPRLRLALVLVPMMALTACMEEGEFNFGSRNADADGPAPIGATRLVERDVEAPEIFEIMDEGLWDGRPSLGGVWVAHPTVTDPERVLIRNEENGRFVIGALFRRERDNPGPELQLSSDAAAALGVLAGNPTMLNVTALRREETTGAEEAAPAGDLTAEAVAATPNGGITATPLDSPAEVPADTIAVAAAAIAEVEATPNSEPVTSASAVLASLSSRADAPLPEASAVVEQEATPAPTPAAAQPAATPVSALDRPYVQIGIFSVQENANNTGQALRGVGLEPTIYDQSSNGRQFWRVVVGPADSVATRDAIVENVRQLGFDDAYFVRR
ncbi:SPOR domain-containing protein [Gymnodinialimonas sp. 2305UL16-5]|uniref:SPOR domain-containing protein n=1 Tax=Gymnodinialimonas mytili TaxID=3126503 RepID=UPI0030A1943D